mmetsp:Transcript_38554/g.84736  ORF Transcript_38554/g.84736 Transcript_38554/m.84736 type:complete len:291 (-) Transcript_38554:807-1679(-)
MAGARRLCFGADFAAVFRADCAVFLARIVSRALPRACRTPKTADFGLCSRPQRHQRRAVEAGDELLDAGIAVSVRRLVEMVAEHDHVGRVRVERMRGCEDRVAEAALFDLRDEVHAPPGFVDDRGVVAHPLRQPLQRTRFGGPMEYVVKCAARGLVDNDHNFEDASRQRLLNEDEDCGLHDAVGVEHREERRRKRLRRWEERLREGGSGNDGLCHRPGRADLQWQAAHLQLRGDHRHRRLHVRRRLAQQLRTPVALRSDALGAPDVLAQRRVGEDAVEVGSGELRGALRD